MAGLVICRYLGPHLFHTIAEDSEASEAATAIRCYPTCALVPGTPPTHTGHLLKHSRIPEECRASQSAVISTTTPHTVVERP